MQPHQKGSHEWFESQIVSSWAVFQAGLKLVNGLGKGVNECEEADDREKSELHSCITKIRESVNEEYNREMSGVRKKWGDYFPERVSEFDSIVESCLVRFSNRV